MITSEKALAHFEAVDLEQFEPGGQLHIATSTPVIGMKAVTTDPAIVTKICAIYQTIRPYLQLVSMIPFVPAKVKNVINAAVMQLDKLCPGT